MISNKDTIVKTVKKCRDTPEYETQHRLKKTESLLFPRNENLAKYFLFCFVS